MQCLDDRQVFDFVGGLMDKTARARAQEHVRGCDDCTARVKDSREALMARTFSPRQVAATEPNDEDFDEITEPQGLRGGLPEVGRVLAGRYRLLRVLGHGGMGVVFEAEDLTLKLPVAVKLLVRELAAHRSYVEQLHQEIRLGRRISSPRVCRVHDLHVDGTLHFLVMERLTGTPLDRRIEEGGALPLAEACDVLDQLCEALEAAEEAGVVHRDLKPANVMIDEQGKVKVMDFGLARDARVDKSQYGGAKGTPAYWAPEQARGEAATAASDVFALGMTALDLFSGKFPWQRSSTEGLKTLPAAFVPVISRCIETEAAKRYPNARALREALKQARAKTERPPARRARRLLPVIGVVAGAAIAGVILYPVPPKQDPKQLRVEANPEEQPRPMVVAPTVETSKQQQPPPKSAVKKKPPEQVAVVQPKVELPVDPPKPVVSPEQVAEVSKTAEAIEKSLGMKALRPKDVPGFGEAMKHARAQLDAGKLDEAKSALSSLEQQVAAARVDAKLIAAKTQRLNAELKAKNLPPVQSAELYAIFEQAQAAYFKGDYAAANKHLNAIEDRLGDRSP